MDFGPSVQNGGIIIFPLPQMIPWLILYGPVNKPTTEQWIRTP